jgi:CRP/FNR family transcriptional regulator
MLAQTLTHPVDHPALMRSNSPKTSTLVNSAVNGASCWTCRLRSTCVPPGMSDAELEQFAALVISHRRLKIGQALYRAGDAFKGIYVVRSGFVKSVALLEDGREQVTGFYTGGDILGIDAIGSIIHPTDAVALEDSDVCLISYERMEQSSRDVLPFQRYLHRAFSVEVGRKQAMMVLLGSMRAEERLATFLLNLSQRLTERGFSPSDFLLRMSREEIGSFLGMKLETVSRVFSKLQREGLLQVDTKHVRLVNIEGLRGMFHPETNASGR